MIFSKDDCLVHLILKVNPFLTSPGKKNCSPCYWLSVPAVFQFNPITLGVCEMVKHLLQDFKRLLGHFLNTKCCKTNIAKRKFTTQGTSVIKTSKSTILELI